MFCISVSSTGQALRDASEELRDDSEIVELALLQVAGAPGGGRFREALQSARAAVEKAGGAGRKPKPPSPLGSCESLCLKTHLAYFSYVSMVF